MKEVELLQGQTLLRFQPEQILPRTGVPASDLTDRIKKELSFAAPIQVQTNPQLMGLPNLGFSAGQFVVGDETIGVVGLVISNNFMGVICQSTKFSDAVTDHIIAVMDRAFGFRFSSAKNMQRDHLSTVVAVFDDSFLSFLDSLGSIERIVEKHRPKNQVINKPFKFQKMSFGRDLGQLQASIEIDSAAFLIERRAGQPYESNAFYCSAPMSSDEHISALEEIERAVR